MKRVIISCLLGVVLGMRVDADPLIEGRVRLASGEPVAGAHVMLFDLTDPRKALVGATTDEAGYFELSLERVQAGTPALPEQFELGQNYPNPFNPTTVIPYQLPVSTHVRLDLFNMLGQRIATLVNGRQAAGFHKAHWDGTDEEGRAVAAGVYLYRLQTDRSSLTHRMVLIDGQAGTPAGAASANLSAVGEAAEELSKAEGSFEAGATEYGLTVSGRGLVTYVDPAFQVGAGRGPVDLVIEAADGTARSKIATSGLLGDVDNNGRVDIADALVVATYLADNSIAIPNNGDISLGDVNQDRRIDYLDVWLIVTYYVMPSNPGLPEGIGSPVPPRIETLKMYWTDLGTGKIQRADLDGSYVEDLVTTGYGKPFGLALDVAAGKMYWTDQGTNKIQRSDLDGSNVEDLITTGISTPLGLALDVAAGKMYWVDGGMDKIQRSDLDGSNVEDLITTGLGLPYRLALDVAGGKMYWTDQGTNKIQRSDLDGSNVEDLITTGISAPVGLALDLAAGKMYWVDAGEDKIQRADLDGSNVEDLITTGLEFPYGLALDVAAGKMYWTDQKTNKIQRSDLDGSNVEDLITTGLGLPSGLVLDTPRASLSPDPSTVAFGNDGTWHTFSVHASEPIVVVTNPGESTSLVESTDLAGAASECPAAGEESTARLDGESIYMAGCGAGKGIVELRRASNQAVLKSYTLSIEEIPTPGTGASKIYWTNRGEDKIQRSDLDGSNVEELITTGSPRGLALDMGQGKMYWTDQGTRKIKRADLDGSNVEDLVTTGLSSPTGLALDVLRGKIYWTDTGTDKIQRADLDGSDVEDLVTTGLTSPNGLALDVVGGKVYWTDYGTDKIQRADLDGSNKQDIVNTGLTSPAGLGLDVVGGKIYWADYGTDKIQRANLDGTSIEELVNTGLTSPRGLSLDLVEDKIYWTDSGTNKVQRADFDGSNVEDLVTIGSGTPNGLALDTPFAWLSPDPSTFAFENEGVWQPFTVLASEPVIVASNPSGTTPRVESTEFDGEFYDCPAETEDNIARHSGQAVYLTGCSRGEATVELRRASDLVVLQTYTFPVAVLKIYWTNTGADKVSRANLDGSNRQVLVSNGSTGSHGLALDLAGGKMYWTGGSKIQRSDLDGSNVEDLVNEGLPRRLVLDLAGGKMYWTDLFNGIRQANLDGSSIQTLVATTNPVPSGLALDLAGGKMYWTGGSKIQRSDLDGSNVENLITTGLGNPLGLALNVSEGRMYWAESDTKKIHRAYMNGNNMETIVSGVQIPSGIAIDSTEGKIYWTDSVNFAGKIQRAELDGSNIETVVSAVGNPQNIALDVP